MKKIFIFSAVLALLTLSLNAQDVCKPRTKAKVANNTRIAQANKVATLPKGKIPTMNELLSGINGMSSILQAASNTDAASSAAGAWRAPLKINADEYTVGPFEGDNVGSTAMGYHSAYPDPQWITVTTELTRDEFINYVGDEIVGFRFALGGNTSRIHKVSDFIAYPRTASGFDNANSHTWNLASIMGGTTAYTFGDITITSSNWFVEFSDITVYDANGNVLQTWNANSTDTYTYTFSGDDATCYNLPEGWGKTVDHIVQEGSGTSDDPYTGYINGGSATASGSITIPSNLLTCSTSSIRIVCTSRVNGGTGTLTVNGNGTSSALTSDLIEYEWTIQSTGSTTSNYVELNGGYTGDGGNWHEFYLPEPIEFNVASDVEALRMGYTVLQYPTSEETFYRFPIGLNDQSTSHNHYVYRYGPETSTSTGELTGWYASSGSYAVPNGWSASNSSGTVTSFSDNNDGSMWLSRGGTITIPASMLNGNSTVQVIINAAKYSGSNRTLSVNGASQTLSSTTFSDFTWNNVDATNGITISLGDSYVSIMSISIVGQVSTTTYVQQWYTADFSERGDLTVQLIFRSNLPKTDAPTLLDMVDNGDGTYTITATATNPTATVTLTIGDQTVTGTGSASITLTQGENAQNVTATATAKEDGKRDSDPATRDYTIPAMGKTATPTITYEETPAAVIVTATGEGTVTLVVNGVTYTGEGTVSATIVRSPEERTVTATATAKDGDLLVSDPDTKDITVHALAGPDSDVEGLLRLHLLLIDQMLEEIPDDNSHPDRYGYVLRYEPNGPQGEGIKESSTVYVDIQKADCDVTGYYSLKEIDNDVNIGINHDQGITMDVVTADVAYDLSSNNDLLWEYLLQGAKDRYPEYQQDYLTKLRKTQNFTYVEMLEGPNKGDEYPNGEHHFLGEEQTGTYGSTFMSYAPSVSTWGIQRRYFEDDGYDNTYGAPIWKSAVGKVVMDQTTKPIAERQKNSVNSVNWTDEGGAASLYILDNVKATGYLPHTDIATVKYEPYMFRIFVESENGLLRPYKVVPQGEGDYDGEHLERVDRELTEADKKGPLCVWSGYIDRNDDDEIVGDPANGVEITLGSDGNQTTYTYLKKKVDRENQSIAWVEYDTIKDPETGEVIDIVVVNDRNAANAMFGALDQLALGSTISKSDLNIFVRFYYVVKGMADGWVPGSRGLGDDPAGYGAESPGMSPDPATGVSEIQYLGEVVETIYYNIQGMKSDKPFDGVNIVVTRYSDGAISVTKVITK